VKATRIKTKENIMARTKYKRVNGSPYNATETKIIGKEISRLIEDGKVLTEEDIIKAAKKADNPLHDFFEWDNRKAAAKYRIGQAKSMLMHINVVENPGTKSEMIYCIVKKVTKGGKSFYTKATSSKNSAKKTRDIRAKLGMTQLRSWYAHYGDLSEFKTVASAIKRFLK